jgi:hypothetical protein
MQPQIIGFQPSIQFQSGKVKTTLAIMSPSPVPEIDFRQLKNEFAEIKETFEELNRVGIHNFNDGITDPSDPLSRSTSV